MLKIKNLHAQVGDTKILNGLNLEVGPVRFTQSWAQTVQENQLASVLSGREAYEVTEGSVDFDGLDLLDIDASDRARVGLFLAFQYPVEIPGVSNMNFMKAAINGKRAHSGLDPIKGTDFLQKVKECASLVELDGRLRDRSVRRVFWR